MERAADTGAPGGFSSQKKSILLHLKRFPDSSLQKIAEALGISKVGALRHLVTLESQRVVERSFRSEGVGRPKVCFRLSAESHRLFPEAYAHMSLCALRFIEERLGRTEVVALLRQRAQEVYAENRARFEGKGLKERVGELARIREEGGYMAEVGSQRRSSFELLEHNCPILSIANQYQEACEVERRMFESLLRAGVEVSHRVVAGDPVCRFLIRPAPAPAP